MSRVPFSFALLKCLHESGFLILKTRMLLGRRNADHGQYGDMLHH